MFSLTTLLHTVSSTPSMSFFLHLGLELGGAHHQVRGGAAFLHAALNTNEFLRIKTTTFLWLEICTSSSASAYTSIMAAGIIWTVRACDITTEETHNPLSMLTPLCAYLHGFSFS